MSGYCSACGNQHCICNDMKIKKYSEIWDKLTKEVEEMEHDTIFGESQIRNPEKWEIKEKKKSFKQQIKECKENGNQIEIDISALHLKMMPSTLSGIINFIDMDVILVCLKYKKSCSSKICKKERGL